MFGSLAGNNERNSYIGKQFSFCFGTSFVGAISRNFKKNPVHWKLSNDEFFLSLWTRSSSASSWILDISLSLSLIILQSLPHTPVKPFKFEPYGTCQNPVLPLSSAFWDGFWQSLCFYCLVRQCTRGSTRASRRCVLVLPIQCRKSLSFIREGREGRAKCAQPRWLGRSSN